MRAGDALGDLLEERLLNLDELSGLDHVENLLDLAQEHHLLLRAGLWPELEQSLDDLLGEGGVLLQELHHAVRQLRVVQRQTPNLVQRDQNLKYIIEIGSNTQ